PGGRASTGWASALAAPQLRHAPSTQDRNCTTTATPGVQTLALGRSQVNQWALVEPTRSHDAPNDTPHVSRVTCYGARSPSSAISSPQLQAHSLGAWPVSFS